MKILLANKFYYNRGGAERWLFEVDGMFKAHGHETVHFSMRHDGNAFSPWSEYFVSEVSYQNPPFSPDSLKAITRMFHSDEVNHAVDRLVEKSHPDIALLGNIYHQLGPSLIRALYRHNIPMVMMLHDFKVVCPSYLLFRNLKPCTKCSKKRFLWSAFHGCGGSKIRGMILCLESIWQANILRTYSYVDAFIAPSQFLISTAAHLGFSYPITHVPNFVHLPQERADPARNIAIGFAGRFSLEKGINILLQAASLLPTVPFRLAGTGPEFEKIQMAAPPNVTLLGQLDQPTLLEEMRNWRAAIIPSLWYENCPYSILEPMALGIPVIGSNCGGITELLTGHGLVFPPGDARSLADNILTLWENPRLCIQLGLKGRNFVSRKYSPDSFMDAITPVFSKAIRKYRTT